MLSFISKEPGDTLQISCNADGWMEPNGTTTPKKGYICAAKVKK